MATRKKTGKPGKPGSQPPKRTKRTVTIDGKEHSVAEAARMTGISRNAMYERLFSLGWTDEEATVKEKRPFPPGKPKLYLTVKTSDGSECKSAKQWADEMDGDSDTNLARICKRVSRGWTDAQALGFAPPPSRSRSKSAIPRTTSTKPVKGPTHEQD